MTRSSIASRLLGRHQNRSDKKTTNSRTTNETNQRQRDAEKAATRKEPPLTTKLNNLFDKTLSRRKNKSKQNSRRKLRQTTSRPNYLTAKKSFSRNFNNNLC